jgi:hypothetical protein
MGQNFFTLHPCDEGIAIDPSAVDGWLVEIGLARADGALGPRFASLIACEGQDPATIQRLIDAPDDSPLSNTFRESWRPCEESDSPIVGGNLEPPECSCGAEVEEHSAALIARWWHDRAARFICHHCGRSTRIPDLDWHHNAGFARTRVELAHGLAPTLEPCPALLEDLARRSGTRWTWTWTRR